MAGKSGRQADRLTNSELAHGCCRACGHRKHLVLPGRICHKCIERALDMVAAMDDGELIAAIEEQRKDMFAPVDPKDVAAALDQMDLDDP